MWGHRLSLGICLVLVALAACAFPRRSTSLSPVQVSVYSQRGSEAPPDVWALEVVDAQIPGQSRGARDWDPSGGLPDPYVRVYRDEQMLWESPTARDTVAPSWDASLPRNVYAPSAARFRFELWDRDELGSEPIGRVTTSGLRIGGEMRLLLEGGATLSVRLRPPVPHRGLGIKLYEVRPEELVVIEVEPHSPAARAGLRPGESIIAIAGETVAGLGAQRASGALSMASERQARLRVRDERGQVRDIDIDRGFTYLAM